MEGDNDAGAYADLTRAPGEGGNMSAKVRKATAAEPIGFAKILNQCMEQLDAYAEVCTAPKQTISRAWWIVGLARALSDEGWHVRTEPDPSIAFPHLWGKGFAIPS